VKKSTYSQWSQFRNCRKLCYWRYEENLVPLAEPKPLHFGRVIHSALEQWHSTGEILKALAPATAAWANVPEQHHDLLNANAMMIAYAQHYATEPFNVVHLERTFDGEIRNPKTGAKSKSFSLAGRYDGLVKQGNDLWLLEHKTASTISGEYLERLWTDFQITLYAYYVEQTMGLKVAGVIYNILSKTRLQYREKDTDEIYMARLAEWYAEPGRFHRETILISRDRFDVLRAELWELTQAYLDCKRRGAWYQNTDYCWHWGRPCSYFPLCRANGDENVKQNFYTRQEPHSELTDNPKED
jgi:hypothetical protein